MKTLSYKSYLFAAAALVMGACNEKDLTLDMPENQLLTEVTLNVDSELPLLIGTDSTISFKVSPDNATFSDLKWSSTNEMIASVDGTGTIHALALGKTVITVCPIVGFGTDATQKSIAVTVIDKVVKVTDIVFSNTETSLYVDDRLQLEWQLMPANHTYSFLIWKSSNEDVATVSQSGLVTGISEGEVTIRAYTNDKGGAVGEYKLKVERSVPAEDVSLKAYGKVMHYFQTINLEYTMTPSTANAATLDWESSDESILTVRRGAVTAVGFGTATITATCTATGKKSSVDLTVAPGYYFWNGANDFEGWTINSSLGSIERKDGKLVATVTTDSNARVYIQRCYSTSRNMMDMNFNDYPVIALRTSDIPAGAQFNINLANLGNTLNCAKGMTKIDLADGDVWYFDAGQYANLSNEEGLVPVRAFMFKILKVAVPTFEINWIGTFESVDKLNEYIAE